MCVSEVTLCAPYERERKNKISGKSVNKKQEPYLFFFYPYFQKFYEKRFFSPQ